MWSDYRGGKPASEMRPPQKLPSATIRPSTDDPLWLREALVEALTPLIAAALDRAVLHKPEE